MGQLLLLEITTLLLPPAVMLPVLLLSTIPLRILLRVVVVRLLPVLMAIRIVIHRNILDILSSSHTSKATELEERLVLVTLQRLLLLSLGQRLQEQENTASRSLLFPLHLVLLLRLIHPILRLPLQVRAMDQVHRMDLLPDTLLHRQGIPVTEITTITVTLATEDHMTLVRGQETTQRGMVVDMEEVQTITPILLLMAHQMTTQVLAMTENMAQSGLAKKNLWDLN